MGKATKWFRNILGFKKPDPTHSPSSQPTSKENRRWSFVKSCREKGSSQNATVSLNESKTRVDDTSYAERGDANKHAIARAWAHSAGRFSSFPPAYVGGCGGTRYELAAVKIQSTFRGYLARRALQALRSLVRLQALVRGHIERKRTAEWLRQMQTLLFRAQARARAGRAQLSESSQSSGNSSHFQHPGPPTPEKIEHSIRSKNSKYGVLSVLKKNGSKSNGSINGGHDKAHIGWNWSDHQMDNRWKCQKRPSIRIGTTNDEKSDKCRNLFHSSYPSVSSEQYSRSFTTSKDSTAHQTVPSPSSCEVQSLSPFTPAKSCCSQNCLSRYTDHNPNYMAYTESSRAKVRSLSAPKQRPQYERSSSTKRDSIHPFGDSKSSAQRFTALQSSFANKAYPGSGRLDNFGMPVGHKF